MMSEEDDEKFTRFIPCLLEAIKTFQMENKPFKPENLADELKISLEDLEKVIDSAVKRGFLQSDENLKITEKGEREIEAHRESFVHDRYVHGTGILRKNL